MVSLAALITELNITPGSLSAPCRLCMEELVLVVSTDTQREMPRALWESRGHRLKAYTSVRQRGGNWGEVTLESDYR